jgi:6-pyruvoyltetrahydropterin/6-carboxytetrahydropterin synthase
MHTIAKKFKFDAAHRLDGLPKGHKCGNLHGHTYVVEVALWSLALEPEGWIFDFNDFKPFKDLIDEAFDHKFLNDVVDFQTTSENLAKHFFYQFVERVELPSHVSVRFVRVSETESTYAEFAR